MSDTDCVNLKEDNTMTIRKYTDRKTIRPEELSGVNGGINIYYDYCKGCGDLTSWSTLNRNNGYCNACVSPPGGATGGW